jgi:hypothetical protein
VRVLTNEEEDCSTYNLYIKKKIAIIRNIETLTARKFKPELAIPIVFTVSVVLDIATIMMRPWEISALCFVLSKGYDC